MERQAAKRNLHRHRTEFDSLYKKAQEFIQQSDDQDKIKELLDLLDEDQRSSLLSQMAKSQQQSKRQLVNFTAESFKKYDRVRVGQFVEKLQDEGVGPFDFATNV